MGSDVLQVEEIRTGRSAAFRALDHH
jgi:hypothetical protein